MLLKTSKPNKPNQIVHNQMILSHCYEYPADPMRWNTSSDFLSVPVRADVQGITNTPDGWTPFHHIYDYYAFRPYAGDNSNFQVRYIYYLHLLHCPENQIEISGEDK